MFFRLLCFFDLQPVPDRRICEWRSCASRGQRQPVTVLFSNLSVNSVANILYAWRRTGGRQPSWALCEYGANLCGFFGNADLVRNHVSLSSCGVVYGAWRDFPSTARQDKNLSKTVYITQLSIT